MPRLLTDILPTWAERSPERLAVEDPETHANYGELNESSLKVATFCRGLNFGVGQRGLLILPNSVWFVRAHFGLLAAGLISVPLDAAVAAGTLEGIVRQCKPVVLFTTQSALKLLRPVVRASSIEHVVIVDASEPVAAGDSFSAHTPQEVLASSLRPDRLPIRSQEDPAALMYTTGTTGEPKGVCLSHRNILAAVENICSFIGYSSADREVVVLPLSHNFGLGHLYCNLYSGGAVYTEAGLLRVGRILKRLESFGASGFPGTPAGYGLLMDRFGSALAQYGRSLRFCVINSAALPPDRTAQLRELLPNIDIMVYYGLTEASRSTFASLSREGPAKYRSVGKPMRDVSIEIRSENGEVLQPGSVGEIAISGPTVSSGYWESAEATELAFLHGWLRTGDLGYLDEEGYLWLAGRKKEQINVGGYKVNPMEVERTLLRHASVEQAGVCGIEDLPGIVGESVVAACVPRPGHAIQHSELERHCQGHLEKFKVPQMFIEVTSLPLTDSGKIKRLELAMQIREQLKVRRYSC